MAPNARGARPHIFAIFLTLSLKFSTTSGLLLPTEGLLADSESVARCCVIWALAPAPGHKDIIMVLGLLRCNGSHVCIHSL
jgi:hypothetical protein